MLVTLVTLALTFQGFLAQPSFTAQAATSSTTGGGPIFLPILLSTPHPARTINAPFFGANDVSLAQMAIAWFGRVEATANYTDVRVGYNDAGLTVYLNTFDRRIWWNETPTPADLTKYDSATLYLNLDGNTGGVPSTHSYRFNVQVYWWGDQSKFQAGYRGDGSGWVTFSQPFTGKSSWDGINSPNSNGDARGWWSSFTIPFSSLGLTKAPTQGSVWGMGLAIHDRDDEAGTAISDQTWPGGLASTRPSTWGRLAFGLPSYTPSNKAPAGTITIRNKLNGAVVTDAAVGGTIGNLCPGDANFIWNDWGNANFSGAPGFNLQNQVNLGDWPCFAKYYLTLPLDGVPRGKAILSAKLTLHLWGGSDPTQAQPSLIQVLTLSDDWSESTLTWNNAPLAMENVSQTWVDPTDFPGWPGLSYTWDVTYALVKAYNSGQPLRLAMHSADYYMHSGKYFVSSDEEDWNEVARPTLEVTWAEP